MTLLTSILAFLVAIAILVPFHEWGHFTVARLCGVKVLRFAVGFGKVLWSHRSRSGVEYCICAIPLGGYVKMLDEREGPVEEAELPVAFNRQSVWKRFLIVLAGPVYNLILAVILLFAVFTLGFQGPIPIIGKLDPASLVYESGLRAQDELVAFEGHPTPTIDNLFQVWSYYVEQPIVHLTVKRGSHEQSIALDQSSLIDKTNEHFFKSLGMQFAWPAELGEISPHSPAMKAGLQRGDRVVRVNDQGVHSWEDLITVISAHPNESLSFHILRHQTPLDIQVTPGKREDGTGMIGAYFPEDYMRFGRLTWPLNIQEAFKQTFDMVNLNLKLMAHMATGRASFDNIGGPVTIAYVAGMSAEKGLVTYLHFLAMISVGLAVLNLLPIPMLDGGHLVFYTLEIIMRRPLSEQAQEIALRFGIFILLALMLLALFNDMMRWV